MARIDERIECLRSLLALNGVELSSSDDGIQQLNDWFRKNVEINPDDRSRLANTWYGVVFDIGLFLGETTLERAPKLRWELCTFGKRNVSYHKHVIMGFTKVPEKNYDVDFDRIVEVFGNRAVHKLKVEPDLFLQAVKEAVADA